MPTDVGAIEILISPDSMRAWGRVNPDGHLDALADGKLISALTAQSIQVTEEVRSRVEHLVGQLAAGEFAKEDVLLAEGRPPMPGEDGSIEWAPECDPAHRHREPETGEGNGEVVDYYARSTVLSVSEGQRVCTVHPPTPGEAGRDIYGREVAPRKGRRAPVRFAESIAHDGDSPHMVAAISGRFNLVGNLAWISPLLTINRNVDFQVGNIKFDGDVIVRGNVLDRFKVECTKDLVVKGMIEAATIDCGGDLVVAGGIAGKQKGRVSVAGKVKVRFIDNAEVVAKGDVFVQKEMVNSTIVSDGKVVTRGAITACKVEACAGIEANVVGSRSGVRTALTVGSTPEVFHRLGRIDREIAQLQDHVVRQRAQIEPMLQRQSALPQIQKKMAVKILAEIKEGLAQLEQLKADKQDFQDTIRQHRGAGVKVWRLIHDGTIVQISKASAMLRDSLRGPLKLVSHHVDGSDRIAATSDQGGLVILESYQQ